MYIYIYTCIYIYVYVYNYYAYLYREHTSASLSLSLAREAKFGVPKSPCPPQGFGFMWAVQERCGLRLGAGVANLI